MTDIVFDTVARDIPIVNNDFELTTQNVASTQNGSIILKGRVVNLLQPQIGCGYETQVLGDNVSEATFELNRTVSQIKADGGNANWQAISAPGEDFDFNMNVNYPN